MDSHKDCYEKNRIALLNYKWWRKKYIPKWEEINQVNTPPLVSKEKVIVVNYTTPRGKGSFVIQTTKNTTRPFFQDLSKPLLVKNEMNGYHYQYLNDNVRMSEDFGDDNHIYMYYDEFQFFLIFIQIIDITPFLKDGKFIFLFGQEELSRDYPLDFKKEYGIDFSIKGQGYNSVRVAEIKRVFASLHTFGNSGNYFFAGILDFHKNLLTLPEFAMAGVNKLCETFLNGKNVAEVIQEVFSGKVSDYPLWEISCMFQEQWSKVSLKFPELMNFFKNLLSLFPPVIIK